jgi:DNA-binding MarR family transcriptional regulator
MSHDIVSTLKSTSHKPGITKNIANHLEVKPQTITPNLKTLEFSKLLSSRRGTVKRGEPSGGKRSENLAFVDR